jgi:hypothetical protein
VQRTHGRDQRERALKVTAGSRNVSTRTDDLHRFLPSIKPLDIEGASPAPGEKIKSDDQSAFRRLRQ